MNVTIELSHAELDDLKAHMKKRLILEIAEKRPITYTQKEIEMKRKKVAFGPVKSEVVWCDLDKDTFASIAGIAEVREYQKGAWLVFRDPRENWADVQKAIQERAEQIV